MDNVVPSSITVNSDRCHVPWWEWIIILLLLIGFIVFLVLYVLCQRNEKALQNQLVNATTATHLANVIFNVVSPNVVITVPVASIPKSANVLYAISSPTLLDNSSQVALALKSGTKVTINVNAVTMIVNLSNLPINNFYYIYVLAMSSTGSTNIFLGDSDAYIWMPPATLMSSTISIFSLATNKYIIGDISSSSLILDFTCPSIPCPSSLASLNGSLNTTNNYMPSVISSTTNNYIPSVISSTASSSNNNYAASVISSTTASTCPVTNNPYQVYGRKANNNNVPASNVATGCTNGSNGLNGLNGLTGLTTMVNNMGLNGLSGMVAAMGNQGNSAANTAAACTVLNECEFGYDSSTGYLSLGTVCGGPNVLYVAYNGTGLTFAIANVGTTILLKWQYVNNFMCTVINGTNMCLVANGSNLVLVSIPDPTKISNDDVNAINGRWAVFTS